jgi:DNA-binding transcriptional LysR family regulator
MLLRSLDPDLLRAFVAVADSASFVRAANATSRSPAAVSMQIKRLEAAVGARLFDRDTRTTTLTPEGERLLGYARRLLALQAEALDAVREQALTGRVTIGAPDDYAAALLPQVLKRFARLYPQIEIAVVCSQSTVLLPLLARSEIDIAFVSRQEGISGTFVRFEPMVWVGLPEALLYKARPLPVALYEAGSAARKLSLEALARAQISYRATYESPSLLGLLSVVEAGLAVAALARCSVPTTLAVLGEMQALPTIAPLEIALVRSERPSAPADALARVAMEQLRTTQ